jgi:hypothetical protein
MLQLYSLQVSYDRTSKDYKAEFTRRYPVRMRSEATGKNQNQSHQHLRG